jgi:uncharacterized Zn finger protein
MSYYSRRDQSEWPEYVSAAQRKQKALQHVNSLKKKGQVCSPVIIEGRTIARTFWGKAWCDNLESYSDYSNRLPRGRTYVRNGSVIDLQISQGKIAAQVMGSELYKIVINILPVVQEKWKALTKACAGRIDSLIELLQGKFSQSVMEILTKKEEGLFPKPKEISMRCSCPDSASMCKHIAAVLYGIGATLDAKPESLFLLRHVNHFELIAASTSSETLLQSHASNAQLDEDDLSALFGIEMESKTHSAPKAATKTKTKISVSKKIAKTAVVEVTATKVIAKRKRSTAKKIIATKENIETVKTVKTRKNSTKIKK